jgi:taurine dioxygenase
MGAQQRNHDQYNAIAERTATRLHEARLAIAQRPQVAERNRDQLFGPYNRAGLGVALEYERMGNRPVSADLQARADAFGVAFEHLGLTLGTILHNIDLKKTLDEDQIKFIRDALLERKVIFFRDQNLSEEEQVAFSRCFGDLDAFPFGPAGEDPFVLEIRHGEKSPGTENGWHTDVTWMEEPSLGSVAQCMVVPPYGGDTLFSDSHACYLGLPKSLKERVQTLHGIHDYRNFLRAAGGSLPEDLISEIKAEIPFGVDHPLLRTHPETGKTGLYIHGGFLRHESLYDEATGETLPAEESTQIVRELLQQHQRSEYQCRFKWEQGSIAFWDNRAVQHYAASDYYPHKRLLRRVTISGDKPYYDPKGDES